MKITFMGHATTLIEIENQRIITDPNFSNQVFGLWKRWQPLPFSPSRLAPADAFLVSNAHYSHFDVLSYKFFKTEVPLITPTGFGKIARKFLPNPITEIKAGKSHLFHALTLHAFPNKSSNFRLFPISKESIAYAIESAEGNLYFNGMSRYGEHFKKVSENLKIKVALLPLSDSENINRKSCSGLKPAEFIKAMQDLQAEYAIPITWGTFGLKPKKTEKALTALQELANRENLNERIRVLKPGESFEAK